MGTDTDKNELQVQFFRAKLAAEKSKIEALKQVKEGKGDFILVDARDGAAYQRAHIPGAISVPLSEVEEHAARLDREREYVTYCWNAT